MGEDGVEESNGASRKEGVGTLLLASRFRDVDIRGLTDVAWGCSVFSSESGEIFVYHAKKRRVFYTRIRQINAFFCLKRTVEQHAYYAKEGVQQ